MKLLSAMNVSRHTTDLVFGNFQYLLFLAFLGIVYIANAHFAEKSVRRIQTLQKEIRELKWEYTSIKSETMFKSMQSQIDESLEPVGLDLENKGPKVIVVD
ncbi:MAG TPA: FtsL-like putative cell division protein [Saprospiraceae bacterium]|nr:FtsL-like putative cell division protein [Saprospiraceae bacterium]HND87998.1 FtsL-like putative cell division protein [Saprospiraceae bacterium]